MTSHNISANRRLVGLLHTFIVGTAVLSIAAWWLDYARVFLVCAPLCTIVTIVVSLLVARYSMDGVSFTTFFNPILFFGIGILIDRHLYPGIFLGGALYGFAYMVPIAVTDLELDYSRRKIEAIRKEMSELKAELRKENAKEENREVRVPAMAENYIAFRKLVSDVSDGLERLAIRADDFDELRAYYDSGQWNRDRLIVLSEGLTGDPGQDEFFSERGLPRLIDDVDELLENLASMSHEDPEKE